MKRKMIVIGLMAKAVGIAVAIDVGCVLLGVRNPRSATRETITQLAALARFSTEEQ